MLFTYVGKGEDSPQVINFMGKQEFVRGQATEVHESLIPKIKGHPCFIEGESDMRTLHEIDKEAAEEVVKKRKSDAKKEAAFKKKHAGE